MFQVYNLISKTDHHIHILNITEVSLEMTMLVKRLQPWWLKPDIQLIQSSVLSTLQVASTYNIGIQVNIGLWGFITIHMVSLSHVNMTTSLLSSKSISHMLSWLLYYCLVSKSHASLTISTLSSQSHDDLTASPLFSQFDTCWRQFNLVKSVSHMQN